MPPCFPAAAVLRRECFEAGFSGALEFGKLSHFCGRLMKGPTVVASRVLYSAVSKCSNVRNLTDVA